MKGDIIYRISFLNFEDVKNDPAFIQVFQNTKIFLFLELEVFSEVIRETVDLMISFSILYVSRNVSRLFEETYTDPYLCEVWLFHHVSIRSETFSKLLNNTVMNIQMRYFTLFIDMHYSQSFFFIIVMLKLTVIIFGSTILVIF